MVRESLKFGLEDMGQIGNLASDIIRKLFGYDGRNLSRNLESLEDSGYTDLRVDLEKYNYDSRITQISDTISQFVPTTPGYYIYVDRDNNKVSISIDDNTMISNISVTIEYIRKGKKQDLDPMYRGFISSYLLKPGNTLDTFKNELNMVELEVKRIIKEVAEDTCEIIEKYNPTYYSNSIYPEQEKEPELVPIYLLDVIYKKIDEKYCPDITDDDEYYLDQLHYWFIGILNKRIEGSIEELESILINKNNRKSPSYIDAHKRFLTEIKKDKKAYHGLVSELKELYKENDEDRGKEIDTDWPESEKIYKNWLGKLETRFTIAYSDDKSALPLIKQKITTGLETLKHIYNMQGKDTGCFEEYGSFILRIPSESLPN